ncbi:MAG: tetratricopeptide repeat protein, partial [Deltaproteobacteria bacterium]|nr:tetratricopeptide repeat protein [Deltaproteobacteria bacterium]
AGMKLAQWYPLILVILCVGIYGQALEFNFVLYDDDAYLLENPRIPAGLTLDNLRWALTTGEMSNWHPLTWISFLIDVDLYGLNPGGFHATNLLLHALNSLVLYAFLFSATGSRTRSFIVAALFAVHPLHVESVAWVSERKGLLCGLFGLLSLWSYSLYARKGGAVRYAMAAVSLCLALSAKAAVVAFPFLFLLLDIWPLRRLNANPPSNDNRSSSSEGFDWPGWQDRRAVGRLVAEKLPFFAIVTVACWLTIKVQKGMLSSSAALELSHRITNAIHSYGWYAAKTFWPSGLSVHHPHPFLAYGGGSPLSYAVVVTAASVLLAISCAAFVVRRRAPYLAVGWLWFLGMLVPVIGIVQVGDAAFAERYMYLPIIGIFVAVVWGLASWIQTAQVNFPLIPRGATALVASVLVAYAATATVQTSQWRDSVTLFEQAYAHYPSDRIVNLTLGVAHQSAGRPEVAIPFFERTLAVDPAYPLANFQRAVAHTQLREWDLAERYFRVALRLTPNIPEVQSNLAGVLLVTGRPESAIPHYRRAIELSPRDSMNRINLASALERVGQTDEALSLLEEIVAQEPDHEPARQVLARVRSNLQ